MTQYWTPPPSGERSMVATARLDARAARLEQRRVAAAEEILRQPDSVGRTATMDLQAASSRPRIGTVAAGWFEALRQWAAATVTTIARRGHYNVMKQFHRLDRAAEVERQSSEEGTE